MPRLLVIDGHNLLFQMFFGMPARIINKDGKAIQGTLGFIGALLKIIRLINPTHVVVLFDKEQENTRKEIDENYKANRTDYTEVPEHQNPFSQLNDIYEALDYLNIRYTEVTGIETDDCVASYVKRYENEMEIIISSFDSDFFQLISDNVKVLRYQGKKTTVCNIEYIYNKFGVLPSKYVDWKSLTGDKADNIRGAEKVGPKTALKLISQFGGLTKIIERATEIDRPCIKDAIITHSDRLIKNYSIIKLDDKAEIPFLINDLVYSYSGITTNEVLLGINLK